MIDVDQALIKNFKIQLIQNI